MASRYEQNEVLRMVLVGKTGIGKSATGNTILGRQCFESKFSAMSMTVECSKSRGEVNGQKVAVIDTPGLFDTRFGMDRTTKDMTQCISYASPGPHVFLVVIRLGRYTEEEMKTVQKIQEVFGEAADRYSMVLFTGGDLLKEEGTPIEEFLDGSPDLQGLVSRCNGQYHVFNNKMKDGTQVTELLQKIKNIVEKNGGSHYTNEMFQEAERAVEEEKQRILKEKEEEIRKKEEELERKIQEKYDKQMEKMKGEFKAELERQRKEREEERKLEREERKREREEMKEERKLEKEEMKEEKKREREEMMEERKRDRDEMMEERRIDREEKNEERRREREELREDRKLDREDREAERKRESEMREREMKMMMDLQKQSDRERKREIAMLQSKFENDARETAEHNNPVRNLVEAGGSVLKAGTNAVGGAFRGLYRGISSIF